MEPISRSSTCAAQPTLLVERILSFRFLRPAGEGFRHGVKNRSTCVGRSIRKVNDLISGPVYGVHGVEREAEASRASSDFEIGDRFGY